MYSQDTGAMFSKPYFPHRLSTLLQKAGNLVYEVETIKRTKRSTLARVVIEAPSSNGETLLAGMSLLYIPEIGAIFVRAFGGLYGLRCAAILHLAMRELGEPSRILVGDGEDVIAVWGWSHRTLPILRRLEQNYTVLEEVDLRQVEKAAEEYLQTVEHLLV
jgi:hypothetical protein